MSKIGRMPIEITEGVEIKLEKREIIIRGPKGELRRTVRPEIKIEIKNNRSNYDDYFRNSWFCFDS